MVNYQNICYHDNNVWTFLERGGKIDELKVENKKQNMIQKSLKERREILVGNKEKVL